MVNYKRVVCEVAVLAVLAASCSAAPAADCADRHFDQRQNGTENYRLNIDGVVIAVAPAESLLAAASELDFGDLLDLEDLNELQQKPKPPAPLKPQESSAPEASPKPGDGDPPAPEAVDVAPIKHELKGEKKDVTHRKNERAKRLKQRLANIIMPLLRRRTHILPTP